MSQMSHWGVMEKFACTADLDATFEREVIHNSTPFLTSLTLLERLCCRLMYSACNVWDIPYCKSMIQEAGALCKIFRRDLVTVCDDWVGILSMVEAMTKCRFYLVGLPHFTLMRSHHPLVLIFILIYTRESMTQATKKNCRICIHCYFVKRKELSIPDALSCSPVDHPTPEDDLNIKMSIN